MLLMKFEARNSCVVTLCTLRATAEPGLPPLSPPPRDWPPQPQRWRPPFSRRLSLRGGASCRFRFRCPCCRQEVKGPRTAMWRNLLSLRQVSQRTISTASRRLLENRVPEKQKLFQEDNGLPVYLKGGIMDGLLYRVTMGLTVFGTGYVLYELMMASMPKKQKWLQDALVTSISSSNSTWPWWQLIVTISLWLNAWNPNLIVTC